VPFRSTEGGVIHFKNLGTSAKLRLYTMNGLKVFETDTSGGTYDWNVRNLAGASVASGVYFYVIESQEGMKKGKMVIIQ
jgi:hypothetical protein